MTTYLLVVHTLVIIGLADLVFLNALALFTAGRWLYGKLSSGWETEATDVHSAD